jgi:peptide/nickel transport system permease protein
MPTSTPAFGTTERQPFRKTTFGRLLRHRSGTVGLVIVLVYMFIALTSTWIAPYSPIVQHSKDRLQPPSSTYALGTDEFGRDILSRLMNGATYSLRVALISVAASGFFGTLAGILSGFLGGWTENILMRLMDLIFAFPAILLALSIAAALGPGESNTILAISIVYMPIFARVARGSVLQIKELEFIEASRSLGANRLRLILQHIVPNSLTQTIIQVSLALSWAILTEASLSFLGLGTVPPAPSWGLMLSDSRTLMELAPWMAIAPGVAIMGGILGFNLLGDGLRDVLDPRLRSVIGAHE